MICEDCKSKPVARGFKFIKCIKCGKDTHVNCFHQNICNDCSDKLGICQYCGKEKQTNLSCQCTYTLVDSDINAWECSHCRHWWTLNKDNPYKNYMNYCPICGYKIAKCIIESVEDLIEKME